MRNLIRLTALAALVMAARADAADTARCGYRVVTVGDSARAVRQACGEPARVVPLVNRFGAGVGERWEYDRSDNTLLVWMAGGTVYQIDEQR